MSHLCEGYEMKMASSPARERRKMRDGGSMGGEANDTEEKIFVSIRVRSLNEKERARNDVSEWECTNGNTIKFKNTLAERSSATEVYTFDRVFDDGCSTKQVYKETIKEVALSVVSGINSSIFAYGQTSSGKTYTMTGITEYAVRDIYDYIEMQEDREFVLKFSAMEIYNEAVRDLLGVDTAPLRLLDDPEKGTVVDKLTEESLEDLSHLQELLTICAAERTTEETSMNETSSRSHQILRLTVESYPRNYVGIESSGTLVASVNFVDLAGSERASQALSAGARLREGGHINRSLLTLGTVIRKLSKGKNGHVPYRDSKLTRILQNSLGGNARTAIICTLSPARSHVEQSRNTLFFASCAKQVTTNAQVNMVTSDKVLVNRLQQELARLENELRSFAPKTVLLQERELQIEQMDKEIKELTRQRDIFQSRVVNLLQSVRKDGFSRASESSIVVNNFHSDKDTTKGSTSRSPNRPQLSVSFSNEHSETSGVANSVHSDNDPRTGSTYKSPNRPQLSVSFSNEHHLQPPETAEDNLLLDGKTPKFVGPDSCQGCEEVANRADAESKENCKEVRFIEMEIVKRDKDIDVPRPASEEVTLPAKLDRDEDAKLSLTKGDNNVNLVAGENSQAALQQKIQDLQRTIDRLVGLAGKSLGSSESNLPGSRSLQLARSRSCKPILSAISTPQFDKLDQETISFLQWQQLEHEIKLSPQFDKLDQKAATPCPVDKLGLEDTSCPQFDKLDHKAATPPRVDNLYLEDTLPAQFDKLDQETITSPSLLEKEYTMSPVHFEDEDKLSELKSHVKKRRTRKYSQTFEMDPIGEAESVMDSDTEDTASVLNFVVKMNKRGKPKPSKKDFHDLVVNTRASETGERMNNATGISFPGMAGVFQPYGFERQQRDIIELWDRCNVPLVHRSYFFLLIKGELSDSVYLDVELRRLSFLEYKFSSGTKWEADGPNLTPNSSMKALNHERKMLSKQVHKKFGKKERDELYQNWGIDLKTKHRSIQLAWRLWTDTKDMIHARESAMLVAKLVGLVGSDVSPKKTFGFGFFGKRKSQKFQTWKDTVSTLLL
ncbi:hypothetical protein L6164_024819 [Bauhinia variegata]|uniref:Uncharacterized protein n=1 Tax=Bauhinia variegata TaxID=167791 RepID=A0ACB9LYT0_BAUVA|nr:hypothetical protein L6164_024819 [Bauhinia variegata]